VVIEYIRYRVDPSRADEFKRTHAAARVLDDDPQLPGLRGGQGRRGPEHFIVRIEWDSVDGHLEGGSGKASASVSSSETCRRSFVRSRR
jgi:hemoglobin